MLRDTIGPNIFLIIVAISYIILVIRGKRQESKVAGNILIGIWACFGCYGLYNIIKVLL